MRSPHVFCQQRRSCSCLSLIVSWVRLSTAKTNTSKAIIYFTVIPFAIGSSASLIFNGKWYTQHAHTQSGEREKNLHFHLANARSQISRPTNGGKVVERRNFSTQRPPPSVFSHPLESLASKWIARDENGIINDSLSSTGTHIQQYFACRLFFGCDFYGCVESALIEWFVELSDFPLVAIVRCCSFICRIRISRIDTVMFHYTDTHTHAHAQRRYGEN